MVREGERGKREKEGERGRDLEFVDLFCQLLHLDGMLSGSSSHLVGGA